MATPTTGSTNIAILDSRIFADLCVGKFYVDVTPSVWLGSGADNVLGAKVKITNPYGVPVKNFGSTYEISPLLSGGMDAVIISNIPTQAGTYQYGKYTIDVTLYDADGTSWTVTKTVQICESDRDNKLRNYGTLSAQLLANCKNGKLTVLTGNVPTYNGVGVESFAADLTLEYPTGSLKVPLETSLPNFSVQLFEGVYKFTGEICATYNYGDNVYVRVKYKINVDKNVRCMMDECCVYEALAELHKKAKEGCSQAEMDNISSTALDALILLKTIKVAAECGQDPSEYITDLEKLLGCECICQCAEGTPVIDNTPAKDISITGCGFTTEIVGLTHHIVLNNYEYIIDVAENGGIIVIGDPTLSEDCVKTQLITFNIAAAYAGIKGLADANTTEAAFWGKIINKVLDAIDGNCVIPNWAIKTLQERVEGIINKLCACCDCDASLSNITTTRQGADVLLEWDSTNAYMVDIFIDGVLNGSVLASVGELLLVGAADGDAHTYSLFPKCSNNKFGTSESGEFTYIGCPTIAPPVVSSNYVTGVSCPYDLTALVTPPPVGYTTEWHTANNTLPSSLVGDPTSVSSGVYFAFTKDTNGCYSTATQVTLVCGEETSCTAPQGLNVNAVTGGFLIQFLSAMFPPPGNSYTVKRRLNSDPDVDGSYTTIGTPVFNGSSGYWEILDTTAVNNTLYTYKAISNCGGSPPETQESLYNFANLTCPSVTLTPTETTIPYSFSNVGGQVDKYEVKLYDASGHILLETQTHLPAFPSPITGTFSGLTSGTTYKVRVTVYVGTYSKNCNMDTVVTGSASGNAIYWWMNNVIGARLIVSDSASPPVEILNELSTTSVKSGSLTGLTGQHEICVQWNSGSGNTIKMRICDALGNEVHYDGSITVFDPESCYTTVTLPHSSAPYYVYVTAGDIEPPLCGA